MSELESGHVLRYLLEAAGLSRSTYYYYRSRGPEDRYVELKDAITKVYNGSHKTYGYRKVTTELGNRGIRRNHKLVQKLMRQMNMRSICKPKWRHRDNGEEAAASPNIVNRNFSADAPYKVMTTDVTEVKWGAHRVFLSPLMDFHDDSIVSYSISLRQNAYLALSMMEKAKAFIGGDMSGCVIHSDQGALYKCRRYRGFLADNNITQSMSRRGNCYDNSPIENFFGCMKAEIITDKTYPSLDKLIASIEGWIDYYNNDRIMLKLGGLSPVQARIKCY